MSSHDRSEPDERGALVRELRSRSRGLRAHPLDLEAVKSRARGIRRRRNAIRGGVAAIVTAVAVPVGLSATSSLSAPDSVAPAPAAPTSTTPSTPPTEPTSRADGSFPLTLRDLPRSSDPGAAEVSYVVSDERLLVTPDGPLRLQSTYGMITPYADGWLAVGTERSYDEVVFLDGDLEVADRRTGAGPTLAVNEDRSRVAYTTRTSGETLLVNAPTDGAAPVTWSVPVLDEGSELVPVGFLDADTVVYRTEGEQPDMGIAGPGRELTPIPGFLRLSDASEATGLVAGMVSYDDLDGACSGVLAAATGEKLWERCDLTVRAFSPDGRFLIAGLGYSDGAAGPPSLSVLDARTGDSLLELAAEPRGRTVVEVNQSAWKDDDTVLAILTEGDAQAMVRIQLDGSVETVTDVFGPVGMDLDLWFAETPR